ncbi:MAG: hypothetical protein WC238_04615 [Parcubacteria group bacterium]|jgi:hypothetical protein
MSTFYLDPDLGNDSTTATPLGWWSRAFTGGTAPTPLVDELVTGATSGSTAKISFITLTSGSWAAGSAAGTMYFYGKSAAFASEQVNCAGGGHIHIAGDFTYCPWKTVNGGATAARIAGGDVIRVKKSPAATKLSGATGQATWTDKSATVTLVEAQTTNIDMCESAWTSNPTGDVGVTLTAIATEGKEGSYCMKFLFDASPQTSIMQAYFATGALNLSSRYRISFWIMSTVALVANNINITLCSNADGTGVVDTFAIPVSTVFANVWTPITLERNGSGALGATIASIAINTGSSITGLASKAVYVDDFIACSLTGLNLQSLITKNSLEQGGDEGLYAIQSINGTTVILDNNPSVRAAASTTMGYTTNGTSPETVDTYFREGFKMHRASGVNNIWSLQDSGAAGNYIELQCGYDPVTNQQTGETIMDGLSASGILVNGNSKSYWKINWLQCFRYVIGIYGQGAACTNWIIDNYSGGNCGNEPLRMLAGNQVANNLRNLTNNAANGLYVGYNTFIQYIGNVSNNATKGIYSTGAVNIDRIVSCRNNGTSGLDLLDGNIIGLIEHLADNAPYGVLFNGSNNVIRKVTSSNNITAFCGNLQYTNYIIEGNISDGTIMDNSTAYYSAKLFIDKLNGSVGRLLTGDGADVITQAATAGGTGIEWLLSITGSQRTIEYRLLYKIARVYCNANKNTTIKFYFKKSHGSNIAASLLCRKYQLAGMTVDVETICPSDTNRNQLSITLSPTASGVVEIEAAVWYVAAVGNVVVDGLIEITET